MSSSFFFKKNPQNFKLCSTMRNKYHVERIHDEYFVGGWVPCQKENLWIRLILYQNHEKPCLSNFNTCVTGNKNVLLNRKQGNLVSGKTIQTNKKHTCSIDPFPYSLLCSYYNWNKYMYLNLRPMTPGGYVIYLI